MSEEPEDKSELPQLPAMIASMPIQIPKSAEEALRILYYHFPLIDWKNLSLVQLRAPDGTELLALPKHIMEQLLTQVVGLCAVLSHDGPAH